MFKKLKKKRLSLRSKKKSTSLRDIHVVGNFVLQTAKIMSASAESLDSVISSSTSLISILDQVFQPIHTGPPSSTAPTSVVNSSKRNSLFHSHSNRSQSTNHSSPVTELQVLAPPPQTLDQSCPSPRTLDQTCPSSQTLDQTCPPPQTLDHTGPPPQTLGHTGPPPQTSLDHDDLDRDLSPEIEVITEENASFADMITSSHTNQTEESGPPSPDTRTPSPKYILPFLDSPPHTTLEVAPSSLNSPKSPVQRRILTEPFKKWFSSNDLYVRPVVSLDTRAQSVQTFKSTTTTLSVEIEISPASGNQRIQILRRGLLISRHRVEARRVLESRVKEAFFTNTPDSPIRNKNKTYLSPTKGVRTTETTISETGTFPSENNTYFLKYFFESLFKINHRTFYNNNHIIFHNNEIHDVERQNKPPKNNFEERRTKAYGDGEKNGLNEISPEECKKCEGTQQTLSPEISSPSTVMGRILDFHPLLLTSCFVGGMLIMIPTFQRLYRWIFSPSVSLPIGTIPPKVSSINFVTKIFPKTSRFENVLFSQYP